MTVPAQNNLVRDRATSSLDITSVIRVCAKNITHLYGSTKYPPSSSSRSEWQHTLSADILKLLRATNFVDGSSIALAALTLLFRYKQHYPRSVAYYDTAYRMFLAAFIVAAKMLADPPTSLIYWAQVCDGKFSCAAIAEMEIDLCAVLEWDLRIDPVTYGWLRRTAEGVDEDDHIEISDEIFEDGSYHVYDVEEENERPGSGSWMNAPPPSYQDAAHDTPVLDQYAFVALPPVPQNEEERDRIALARMLERAFAPRNRQRRTVAARGKSLVASATKRVRKIVSRRPGALVRS